MTSTKWGYGASLVAALGMAGCIATEGDSGSGEGEGAAGEHGIAEISSALTGTAFIVGMVKDTIGVPVPGVIVNLSGPASHSAVTDSNGVYQFNVLPNGTYTVRPSKAGARFNVTSRNVNATSSGVEAAFTCNSGCEGTASVNEFKELTITDTSVIDDPRTSNFTNGPWSFRFLMEQMTPPGTDPSDFVLSWLQGFKATAGPINGRPVDDRLVDDLISGWAKKANGKLDLARAEFRLLAIVNRTDLHINGRGEARFVFANFEGDFSDPDSIVDRQFTVILEYEIPVATPAGVQILRNEWISQFHALGSLSFGSTFNARLQAITDKFTRAGTTPAKPNGSSIRQVRTNEFVFGSPWQLREFHLVKNSAGQGFLKLGPVAQTPDSTLNGNAALGTFIKSNSLRIRHGLTTIPSTFIGGQSQENDIPWSFPQQLTAAQETTRRAFAGQTCSGCHNAEVERLQNFYQLSPGPGGGISFDDGKNSLSGFILKVDLPRRKRFMQNRLACSNSSNCAPGAESMVF